jgi:phage tail-like protein
MATFRDRPYGQFNFRVEIDGVGDGAEIAGGFQEVSGLGLEITVAEYRNGNEATNLARKITTMSKVPDVTLKRGVIGDLGLSEWIQTIRDGKQDQKRRVTVQLLTEDREAVAQEWRLTGACPIKYTGPTLNGNGTEVAIEELVLSCELIEQA